MNWKALFIAMGCTLIGIPALLGLLLLEYVVASLWHEHSPTSYAIAVGSLLGCLAFAFAFTIYRAVASAPKEAKTD